jgi:phosphate transport system substrate-binding protein
MHQVTSHCQNQLQFQPSWVRRSKSADGIVTYDYDTKVPGAYPLGIISYMLLETSYKNKEKGKAVVELAEYLLSPECSLGAASTGFIVD